MIDMLTLLLASYGLTFGLMNDKVKFLTDLLKRLPLFVREDRTFFDRVFACPYCTGFHTGWMLYLFSEIPVWVSGSGDDVLTAVPAFAFALASSTACYAIDVLIQWFERE